MFVDYNKPFYGTIEGVMPAEECLRFVEYAENQPRETATINSAGGVALRPDVRNNTRLIVDDPELAALLWPRIEPHVPSVFHEVWNVKGLNERFRLYRYEDGQRFAPHHDGPFIRHSRERSILSVLIYLSDDFVGGATNFLDLEESIIPKQGLCLFFQHPLLHEGEPVSQGVKHVLRTDVMYECPIEM